MAASRGRAVRGTAAVKAEVRHGEVYAEANESFAKFVAYSSGYLLWGLVALIAGALLLAL